MILKSPQFMWVWRTSGPDGARPRGRKSAAAFGLLDVTGSRALSKWYSREFHMKTASSSPTSSNINPLRSLWGGGLIVHISTAHLLLYAPIIYWWEGGWIIEYPHREGSARSCFSTVDYLKWVEEGGASLPPQCVCEFVCNTLLSACTQPPAPALDPGPNHGSSPANHRFNICN